MRFFSYIAVSFLLLGQAFAQSSSPQVRQYADWVGEMYDGHRALETTAYVSQFWRLPGNPGYDSTIFRVRDLLEDAGYVDEEKHPDAPLSYRIESREMARPAWSPIDASLTLQGDKAPLMSFRSNRNMIAIQSASTAATGIEAKIVWLKDLSAESWQQNLQGKIVFCEASPYRFYTKARKKGAIGILSYDLPDYNQPEKNDTLVSFSGLPIRHADGGWGIFLSKSARDQLVERLEKGMKRIQVKVQTAFHDKPELCIIANVRGQQKPDERLVFSAHVQEPGANDNASGVGCQAEMARIAALLWKENKVRPARTLTFYWGNEISGIHRYLSEDNTRTKGVLWGISLDMVGENTAKTGGTFLIEKLPDPSAIWTRGKDQHTEWGSGDVDKDDLFPHFLNDFILNRCLERAAFTGWEVKTNPYEGGSDHIPFLRAKKPAVLLWHFTDQFYHTDGDRIDKVSATTLAHVGISSLVSALTLCNGNEETAFFVLEEVEKAALTRLKDEFQLSQQAIREGSSPKTEAEILSAWADWYKKAMQTCMEIPYTGASQTIQKKITASQSKLSQKLLSYLQNLN